MNTEKTYPQMKVEFYKKYLDKIVPMVKIYENTRKTRLCLAVLLSSILIILGSILMYTAFTIPEYHIRNNSNCIKGAISLYASAYFLWTWIKKRFENTIKEKIMPTVCSCFDNIKWKHADYSGGEVFRHAGIVPKYNSETYDDIFYGAYKDVNMEIIEPIYKVRGGKHTTTVFDGVIVKLDMNKKFIGHTVIKPSSLIHISPLPHLRYTQLEDIQFNKIFDVYTNDEVDARYLITPSFMERLKSMEIAFKAISVSCAFFDNLLIIALETPYDIFSLCPLTKRIDDSKQYFQMYEELISILKLIDHFKLNQKIGL